MKTRKIIARFGILALIFITLCEAQKDTIDYAKVRRAIIVNYLDKIERQLNKSGRPITSASDTLLDLSGGKLFSQHLGWLDKKEFIRHLFQEDIYSIGRNRYSQIDTMEERYYPILEIHQTNYHPFFFKLGFSAYEELFLDEVSRHGILLKDEQDLMRKKVDKILGLKGKLTRTNYGTEGGQLGDKLVRSDSKFDWPGDL